jgi:hypothetical protein
MSLAAVFLISGVAKIAAPEDFVRSAIKLTGLDGARFQRALALVPWIELALAVSLVTGLFAWAVALIAIAVLLMFTLVLLAGIVRGVNAPCNCFGRWLPEVSGRITVLRNVALILIGILVVGAEPDQLSSDLTDAVGTTSGTDFWLLVASLIGLVLGLAVMGQAATTFGQRAIPTQGQSPGSTPLGAEVE